MKLLVLISEVVARNSALTKFWRCLNARHSLEQYSSDYLSKRVIRHSLVFHLSAKTNDWSKTATIETKLTNLDESPAKNMKARRLQINLQNLAQDVTRVPGFRSEDFWGKMYLNDVVLQSNYGKLQPQFCNTDKTKYQVNYAFHNIW